MDTKVDVLSTDAAYAAACAADKAFQSELVRQFGKDAAADYRYRRASHDAKTAAAREGFIAATRGMRAALAAAGAQP